MRLLLPLVLTLFTATARSQTFTTTSFGQLAWLEGAWKGTSTQGPFYEAWQKLNDSTLLNLEVEIKSGDTTIKESTALRLRNGQVLLGNSPTSWTGSRLMANELVLRNDSLRFSQTIVWLHTAEDHWLTILEHPRSTVIYDMTRDSALEQKVAAWIRGRKGGK